MKRERSTRLLGMMLIILSVSSTLASAQAAYPWQKPSEPGPPAWEPQRPVTAPPDETPPEISLSVIGMQDANGEGAGQPTAETTYTDEDGNFVRVYQFDADKDGYKFRFNVEIKDGLLGAEEEVQWGASGINKQSVKLHVGSSSYTMSEADATKTNTHRAEYNSKGIILRKGTEDLVIYVDCRDNEGNSAKSDLVKVSVRSGQKVISKEDKQIRDAKWLNIKIRAKKGEGPMRLDTTKNKWYYYVVCEYRIHATGGGPVHGTSRIEDQDTVQKVAYQKWWEYQVTGELDKSREYGSRMFYFWDSSGIFVGWLIGSDYHGLALNTAGNAAELVGGNYGGKYTGLGG